MNSPNIGIEHRRTAHGGDDSALCIEVSPVRFSSVDGSAMTVHDEPERTQAFGVYIRNPLAFHIQDFGPESVDPDRRVTLGEAKFAAFEYADNLADHLGCSVESWLARPGPVDGPLHGDLSARGFLLEGGGAAPAFYCFPARFGDVRVTAKDGGEIPTDRDWLVGVYAGDEGGPQFVERELVFSVSSDDGLPLPGVLTGAAAFVAELPAPAAPGAPPADEAEEAWPCPLPVEIFDDGIAQRHYLARLPAGYVVFSDLSGQDFPRAGDWMVAAGFGDLGDEDSTARPACEFARVRTTDGADVQATLDSMLAIVGSAGD